MGTDATIRKIVQYTTPDNIEFPADLRKVKKPRAYNKRKRDNMEKRTKTGYVEPIQVQEANNSELYETPTQVQQTNTIHETEPEKTEPQFEEKQTATQNITPQYNTTNSITKHYTTHTHIHTYTH